MQSVITKNWSDSLTFEDVAELVGISRRAVMKRKGIDNYVMSKISCGGRPRVMLHPDVLNLFGITYNQPDDELKPKKARSHKGIACKVTPEREKTFIETALSIYLSQGNRKYVQNSCIKAAAELWDEYYQEQFKNYHEMAEYFYKRRITRRDKLFVGYAYRNPAWEVQWERQWKRHNQALISTPTLHYKWLDIMEDAEVIGEGFGSASIWAIDDHIGDSFMFNDNGSGYHGKLPKGLFLIDAVTGMWLDYMEGEVNSTMLIHMIIRNVMKYGIPFAIMLENSKVMRNLKVDEIIKSLYPDTYLEFCSQDNGNWFNTLFEKAKSPIVRNLPNIPRAPFKARLERLFQEIKRWEGYIFPETFQAGGLDPIQLRCSNTPIQPNSKTYTIENYVESLNYFMKEVYPKSIRTKMFENFDRRAGLLPTIENVWNYYGGENPGTHKAPSTANLGTALYYLSKLDIEDNKIIRRESKALPGRVSCTVNQCEYLFTDAKLAEYVGKKIQIVFIPDNLMSAMSNNQLEGFQSFDSTGKYAALFCDTKHNGLEFINICKDQVIRTVADVKPNRAHVQAVRKEMKIIETQNHNPNFRAVAQERIIQAPKIEALPIPEIKQLPEAEIVDSELLNLLNL